MHIYVTGTMTTVVQTTVTKREVGTFTVDRHPPLQLPRDPYTSTSPTTRTPVLRETTLDPRVLL